MASLAFDEGAKQLASGGSVDYAANTIKARMVLASVTPSRTATVMTGLTAVGTDQTLGSKTLTKDTTNHRIVYDAADPTWTAVAAGAAIGYVIVYKFVTNDGDSIPLFQITVSNVTPNGSDTTWPIHADGIGYIAL